MAHFKLIGNQDSERPIDIEEHNREIHENAALWQKKPVLRKIYSAFYTEIASRTQRQIPGLIVELGSGIGNLKQVIQDCITTDLFNNPWLDRVENAYALTFADRSISNLILFDVWHHLQYPGNALREFHRVLVPNGRLILHEPAMGLMGRLVYGLFHHEPLGLKEPIEWEAPTGLKLSDYPYFAAESRASRIFWRKNWPEELASWQREEIVLWSSLDYLGSGGFRGPQIYPTSVLSVIQKIDRFLSRFPRLFASRMLIVISKKS